MKRTITACLLALCAFCLTPGVSGAADVPGVFYKHYGSSPHPDFEGECLVVMWYQINHLNNDEDRFNVEAILFEDGKILLQYGPGDPEQGVGTTVGIQTTEGQAYEYYCEHGYGGLEPSSDQEKSYDPPSLVGKAGGPLPGSMALLFTPVGFVPDFSGKNGAHYTITDSRFTDEFDYHMIDIHNTGTNINIYGDDTNAGPFNIGFDFPFFWSSYDHFWASTNCLLSFNGGSSHYSNQCLPTNSPDLDMIAAFWDDMYVSGTAEEEGGVKEDYSQYTKQKKDKKFELFGLDCFISAAAGEANALLPLLMAVACAASGFLGRKRMGK